MHAQEGPRRWRRPESRAWPAVLLALLAGCAGSSTGSGSADAVSQQDAGKIELLAPGRRLPPSASRVRSNVQHFQDTSLHVRFDAPLAEAASFAKDLVGPLRAEGEIFIAPQPDLDWWPKSTPRGASLGEGKIIDGDQSIYVQLIFLPHGDAATIWMHMFNT